MFLIFFKGLFFLFHRFVVGISCFVGFMCVGVRCMYVASLSLVSLIFDV
jgi:hypothetical protein